MSTPTTADAMRTAPGDAVLNWQAEPADLAAALQGPTLASLGELGAISVSGADADAFLQAQLTNDSAAAKVGFVRNGYCSPKGRLLAVFDHWATSQEHVLLLPQELLPALLKRLAMFVLRAKVKLADSSATWRTYGLVGPGSAQQLQHAALPVPEVGATIVTDVACVWRHADGTRGRERFQVLVRADAPQPTLTEARRVDAGVWWWSQIDAGEPTVWRTTQEKFVPQMINLEVLGGVNFRKGCYPGQEVVARSQYLGKLRRRMHLAHTPSLAAAGDDVFAEGDAQPIGTVVMCASAPDGGADLLFECPQDALTRPLRLADGSALTCRDVPYPLVDVTA